MSEEKHKGTSILFVNDKEEVLLFLRDNIPTIPFPNCWGVPGGHMEKDETPEGCIVREMLEEIGINIGKPTLFKETELDDRVEYTFWKKVSFNIKKISLQEGQGMRWFGEDEIKNLSDDEIYPGFKLIITEFFSEKPFER